MQTIVCPHCKKSLEITQALHDETVEKILDAEKEKFIKELEKVKTEEKERVEKKIRQEMDIQFKDLENEKNDSQKRIEKLMQEVLKANGEMRALKQKDEEREIETQKKLQTEREKIKEEVVKLETEKANLKLLEVTKQLEDTKKALEEAQRKSTQTSQQLQGEVLELELEEFLRNSFPTDEIIAIGKGVHGADVRHIVKSPKGFVCGVILWESKRTKHWEDKWLEKLKTDLRAEKANIPVIISSDLPKDAKSGIGLKMGVWVVSHALILPLAELLRKNLLDVAYQKVVAANKSEKADLLYSYVTSHEFQQQVELVVEVYKDMQEQIIKERMAFEKSWKQREAQVHKLLLGTAAIVGSMQGKVGASMPHIKGLEILEIESGK